MGAVSKYAYKEAFGKPKTGVWFACKSKKESGRHSKTLAERLDGKDKKTGTVRGLVASKRSQQTKTKMLPLGAIATYVDI